jgi:hypothetical protein
VTWPPPSPVRAGREGLVCFAQRPGWRSAAGSLARCQVASPPSRHACRAPRVPPLPTATRFAVPAVSWCQDVRMPTVPWSPCPRPPSASACPASACPASARPVSDVRCPVPGVRASGVSECPVSGVRCPVSGSGVYFVRTGELVERVDAADSQTSRDRPGRGTYLTRGSLSPD